MFTTRPILMDRSNTSSGPSPKTLYIVDSDEKVNAKRAGPTHNQGQAPCRRHRYNHVDCPWRSELHRPARNKCHIQRPSQDKPHDQANGGEPYWPNLDPEPGSQIDSKTSRR